MVEFDDLTVNNVLTLGDVDLSGANSVLTINDSFHSDKPYHNFCRIATTDGTYNCGLDFYRDYGGGNQTHFAIHHYNRICIFTEGLSFNLENPVGTSYFQVLSSGQARLPATGSEGGLLIGGDANLYHSAADTLKTDDSLDIQSGDNIAQHGLLINTGWINLNDYTENMPFDVKIRGTRCVSVQTNGALTGWQNFFHIYPENVGYTPQQGEVTVHDFLYSNDYNNPDVGGKFRLGHLEAGGLDVDIYGALFRYPEVAPAVVTSHHLIVRKDFLVRGMINSYEGVVYLHGGNYNRGWGPDSRNPMINLTDAVVDYEDPTGYTLNTLEIRHNIDGWGWGDLECGRIYAHRTIGAGTWASVSTVPLYKGSGNIIGYNQSTIRAKQNVTDLTDCSWLYDLRPVNFDWKDQKRAKEDGRQLGLIAEEVNALCPQLTWLDSEGRPEGVHYEWLGVPIIVELRKLKTEVADLRQQIKQLTTNIGD